MKKISVILAVISVGVLGVAMVTRAVTVGPVKIVLKADPGQTIHGSMFLKNDDSQPQTFYPSFETFTEKNGNRAFSATPSDLQSWFNVSASVKLAPGEQKNIPFTIAVPGNAAPGGHFAVMWWSTTPPNQNNQQVAIITRAGVLVYLTVSGDIQELGALTLNGPLLAIGFPANFSAAFTDTGNVALSPQGTFSVRSVFGNTVFSAPFNTGGAIVLPQSSDGFALAWTGDGLSVGPYRAVLSITYGDSGKTATQTKWFFFVSGKMFIVILTLILLGFVFPPLVRRYNKWIVEKARGKS